MSDIIVKGAREHNLHHVNFFGVDLVLPRNKLICFTGNAYFRGASSGKSSLAFDTLYAEGQRRYIESLSSYARQFLGQLPKPDVDQIAGLSPAISISQKSGGQNTRSTVGTITEIYDFLHSTMSKQFVLLCFFCLMLPLLICCPCRGETDSQQRSIEGNKTAEETLAEIVINDLRDFSEYSRKHYDKTIGEKYLEAKSKDKFEYWKKAADAGIAEGQILLAMCHSLGFCVSQDDTESVKWYRKAAEQGNARAQSHIGWLYQNGIDVAKDESEAVLWYRKAVEQEFASAQILLGQCYFFGLGVPEDKKEAINWYRKAAGQGDAGGQVVLGEHYLYGEGVSKDEVEAVRWFRKAVEQDDAFGQYRLGECYFVYRSPLKIGLP